MIFVGGGWFTEYKESYRGVKNYNGWKKTAKMEFLSDFDSNMWEPITDMYQKIEGHCFVTMNDEEILSIGGMHEEGYTVNDTWVFNINTKKWKPGVPMNSSRTHHKCARITDSNGKTFIIAAGGEIGTNYEKFITNTTTNITKSTWPTTLKVTANVKIFDPVKQEWSKFHDLPRPLGGSKLIEDGRGGVLMVGGDDTGTFSGHVSDIIYLSGKEGTWERTFKSLEKPSSHTVAMLIPDSYVQC
jgi:N-acetylneuraminic acid mutarotase